MHLQQIHETFPRDVVEVVFVISRASESSRKFGFPRFKEDLKLTFTALDDRDNRVVNLYRLNTKSSVAKNIIVDRKGKLRLIGEFTPLEEMVSTLEKLLGGGKKVDLSTTKKALAALKAPEPYVRWKAVQALGSAGDKSLVDPLLEATADSDGSVRECAAVALGKIGDEKAAEALLAGLKDKSSSVRLASIAALGKIGSEAAVEPLLKALSDKCGETRECAALALGTIGNKKAVAPLLAALDDKSAFVRIAAVKALGPLKDERAIVPLAKRLADSIYLANAARSLAMINRHELVEKAIEGQQGIYRSLDEGRFAAYAYLHLGQAYTEIGSLDAGLACLKKATGIHPALGRSVNLIMGDLYLKKGQLDKALAEYDKYQLPAKAQIESGTTNAWVYNNLSWFYVEKKIRPTESLSLAKKANEMMPNTANILDTLAWAYMRSGEFDKAFQTFVKVFTLEPDNDSSWKGVSELVKSDVKRKQIRKLFRAFSRDMKDLAAKDSKANVRLKTVQTEFNKRFGKKKKARTF